MQNWLESAYAIVFDEQCEMQAAIVDGLRALGVDDVDRAETHDELEQLLHERFVDILVLGVGESMGATCDFVQRVRAGKFAANPFVAIVAATRCTDDGSIAALRNCGVDAVVDLPLSKTGLETAVDKLMAGGRQFVATCDYVGPDRRRNASRSGAECFDVLNSIQIRASGLSREAVEERIAQELAASRQRLSTERQRQDVLQLCILWRLLEQKRLGTPDFATTLTRAAAICDDIESREIELHSGDSRRSCESVRSAIVTLETCARSAAPDSELARPVIFSAKEKLGEAAMDLAELHVPGGLAPSKLFELDALAAKFDIRRSQGDVFARSVVARASATATRFG